MPTKLLSVEADILKHVDVIKETQHIRTVKTEARIVTVSDIKKASRVYIEVELTAYTSDIESCGKTDGVTASGRIASRGTVAAPKIIKLGTSVFINGSPCRAEDRGGAIIVKPDGKYIFDVWMPTRKQAKEFGRVKAKMYKENGKYFIEY
jgi:3D (Asp-Asp-Asp) domain-containing protein